MLPTDENDLPEYIFYRKEIFYAVKPKGHRNQFG